ncbi:hypothetical protein [Trinickia sp.]
MTGVGQMIEERIIDLERDALRCRGTHGGDLELHCTAKAITALFRA